MAVRSVSCPRFWHLGISAVAGIIYVIGWEITLAVTDFAFIDHGAHRGRGGARRGSSATDMGAWSLRIGEFRRSESAVPGYDRLVEIFQ